MSIPDLPKEPVFWSDSIEKLSRKVEEINDGDNPLELSGEDPRIKELITKLLGETISRELRLGTMPVILGETKNCTADKVFKDISKLPKEQRFLAERVFLISFLTFYKCFKSLMHLKEKIVLSDDMSDKEVKRVILEKKGSRAPFKFDESKIRRVLDSLQIIKDESVRIRLTKLYGQSLEFKLLSQEAVCLSKFDEKSGFNLVWHKP